MRSTLLPPLVLIACLVCLLPSALAGEPCDKGVARLVSLQGTVAIQRAGSANWLPTRLDDTLCAGDQLQVGELSRAALLLSSGAIVRLDQLSTVTLAPAAGEQGLLLQLLRGAMHFFSRTPRTLQVATPFVNGSIEGTEVYMASTAADSRVAVLEGALRIENALGALVLRSGEAAEILAGAAPRKLPEGDPRRFIAWTLYYPPIVGLQSPPADAGPTAALAQAGARLRAGDTAGAMAALATAGETPAALAMRASLLLYVGRVEEAGGLIARLGQIAPQAAEALALQAIIDAAQNRKAEALQRGRAAVAAAPESSVAWMALSIAQQANFDLAGARQSLTKATAANAQDALAWARLAEIELALGESSAATAAAERAAQLLPQLSRVQLVRGFSLLTRIKLDEALAALQSAVSQDSADPLPRLGLGLAQIRKGELAAGRQNIEIAAALDPTSSLIRSYLGKAYFEEKRDKLAAPQLEMAKALDPADPTPYLYDAIRKQTQNRPVEALQDIQRSIELNDNRAVYRSRLLLDEDLAVRSASLGRIYRDLGFDQLALAEGFKSVSSAPGDFSGHRFLADTYAALPRHGIARVSELLQSQLLQPLNVTPLQPSLAEANLGILEGTGPGELSFNEYNPLFLRNRLTLQTSGIVGQNHTIGEEIVHAGLWNNISYSLGQMHFENDGFRENNEQRQDLFNGFVQAALTHNTQVQGEFRSRRVDQGDPEILFDPNNYYPDYEQDLEVDTYRFGLRHLLNPTSELIFSWMAQRNDLRGSEAYAIEIIPQLLYLNGKWGLKDEIDSNSLDLQHIYRKERLRLVSGGGYYWGEQQKGAYNDSYGDDTFDSSTHERADIDQWYGYSYAQLELQRWSTVVLGLSADDFNDARMEQQQLNPKLGLLLTPLEGTTLRLAGFRHLTRNLVADQTIEPTQVAGFNQLYDDVAGTDAWVAGAAIDQRLAVNLFAGLEYSNRWLEVPYTVVDPSMVEDSEAEWRERVGRAYIYWAPHPWWSFKTEYMLEKFDNREDFEGLESFYELTTHRLRFGGTCHLPWGLFAVLQATWVNQSGEFPQQVLGSAPLVLEAEDRFWVLDARLGYRLPRRWGIVSLEVKNLLDESFQFQDTDPGNPSITPERLALLRLTLSF